MRKRKTSAHALAGLLFVTLMLVMSGCPGSGPDYSQQYQPPPPQSEQSQQYQTPPQQPHSPQQYQPPPSAGAQPAAPAAPAVPSEQNQPEIVKVALSTMDRDLQLSQTAAGGAKFDVKEVYATGDTATPVACVLRFYGLSHYDWVYSDRTYLYDGVARRWIPRKVRTVTTYKDGSQSVSP